MKVIDVHTHGINGYDTRTTSEDRILKIAEIHGSHGTSEIIPTVYTSSIESMRENMHAITRAMECQESGIRSQESEAKIAGIYLEGPFLNQTRCGALDPQYFQKPAHTVFKRLIEGFEDIVKIITIAPELEGAQKLIRAVSDMGIIVSMGHSDATYLEAEAGFHAGARGITHIFNAMRGIHHREPGLAGFGLMNNGIYIEVIADPFHLDRKMLELIFSLKIPEKIIIISDTVQTSKIADSSAAISDEDNKLMGGSMTICQSAERLIQLGLDKEVVLKTISENPDTYLKTFS
jgi:N-acetylglucosamine-6-phosphate deacetylase